MTKYVDQFGNIYFVSSNEDKTKLKGLCIIKNPSKNQRKISSIDGLNYVDSEEQAQKELNAYSKTMKLSIYYDAETKYRNGTQACCRTCEYYKENMGNYASTITYYDFTNKKKRTFRMKKSSAYCFHPKMNKNVKPFKLNKNHIQWYGLVPECPFNIHTHSCSYCSKRMTTSDETHKSCEKKQYNF